jgi:hypothetical protein
MSVVFVTGSAAVGDSGFAGRVELEGVCAASRLDLALEEASMADTDQCIVTGPIRSGAQIGRVANGGLLVFIYDDADEPGIRAGNHPILSTFDGTRPRKTGSLRSRLIVYELHQEGDVNVEVVVGDPLTGAELALGNWYPPQLGHLTVTAGRLWMHTYGSLPMGERAGEAKQGASFDLPPGDYTLSLYRKRWNHPDMEAKARAARAAGVDVDGNRTNEIVVLSLYDGQTLDGAMFFKAPPLNG